MLYGVVPGKIERELSVRGRTNDLKRPHFVRLTRISQVNSQDAVSSAKVGKGKSVSLILGRLSSVASKGDI